MVRVVDLVAGELGLGLVADAAFVHHFLAAHALFVVALLDALMAAAGKELFTKRVAHGHWFDTALSLPTQETLHSFVTRRTINLARRVFLTGQTLSCVANLLTLVVRAVQVASTLLVTRNLGRAAERAVDLLSAEAFLLDGHTARTAGASMAQLLARVNSTV